MLSRTKPICWWCIILKLGDINRMQSNKNNQSKHSKSIEPNWTNGSNGTNETLVSIDLFCSIVFDFFFQSSDIQRCSVYRQSGWRKWDKAYKFKIQDHFSQRPFVTSYCLIGFEFRTIQFFLMFNRFSLFGNQTSIIWLHLIVFDWFCNQKVWLTSPEDY